MSKTKPANSNKQANSIVIVLGFDDDAKPHAAHLLEIKPENVAKLPLAENLKAYRVTSADLAGLALRTPQGKLDPPHKIAVPVVSQDLYSEIVAALVADPKQAMTKSPPQSDMPAMRRFPSSHDQIATGDLVIAEEGPGYGWWPAIVDTRKGDTLFLRYRDFPGLPRFARHRGAVAVMHPPAK